MRSPWSISFLIAGTLCLASGTDRRAWQPAAGSAEEAQVINVTAKKYEFEPATIRVKQGTRVQLKITATDHAHGFKVKEGDAQGKPGLVFSPPQDCTKIEEGKTETIEFVAQAPGTYPFRCCVHCGWHHRAMKGEIIVEP
jgi:heme/copper-type cytochrome/quinol oxidase subunit 2